VSGPSAAPPGWYHDGQGVRWWDGGAWGPYAPPVAPAPPGPPRDPVRDGKVYAVLSHLGFFGGGFLLPLIFRYADTGKNPYVRHHATEAMNFNLTFLIAWLVLWPVTVIVLVLDGGGLAGGLLTLSFVVWVAGAVFAVSAAIKASHGEWYRYPVSIRFVGRNEPRVPAR